MGRNCWWGYFATASLREGGGENVTLEVRAPEAWFPQLPRARMSFVQMDLAFAVAWFIQKGGSYMNYYMYHGGTNFGRTACGLFITTRYDYDELINEFVTRKSLLLL